MNEELLSLEKEALVEISNCNDLKVLNDLNIGKINAENVLTDFMSILNEIQYYFREGTTVRDLDGKDFYDLVKLSHQARDMLQNMNMGLKE